MRAKILIDNITNDNLLAEWGLAIFLDYEGHKILLDTGASETFAANARTLGLPLNEVEFGVLSHAHYDHSDGLSCFFQENQKAKFYIRKGAGENCYSGKNPFFKKYIGIRRGILKEYADRIVYAEGKLEVMPGVFLLPHGTPGLGAVGKRAGMYVKIHGFYVPDSFAHEQSLIFRTEKGLVIFNSCSHGGADNIIRETEAAFPGEPIEAMIGGFHLFRSTDEEVRAFAGRVRATGIGRIYTGHCTGDHAFALLKEELGDAVKQLYTGMEIRI